MHAALTLWGRAGRRLWANLPRLIAANLLWLLLAWPLVTLGAATLALYAWLRRAVLEYEEARAEHRKAQESPLGLLRDLRRLWWPGTLWLGANVAVAAVLLSNALVWRAKLGPLGGLWVELLTGYLAWLWLAGQPYLLDALAEGRPLGASLAEAARLVAAFPLYAHLCALPPLLLALLGWWFKTLWPAVGASALLLYWAQVATFDPRARPPAHELF